MGESHTSGPWTPDRRACFVFAHDEQMIVCEIRGWGFLTGAGASGFSDEKAEAIQRANAHLIAAAPDLLDALKGLVCCCTTEDGAVSPEPRNRGKWLDAMVKSVAAIAKAEPHE